MADEEQVPISAQKQVHGFAIAQNVASEDHLQATSPNSEKKDKGGLIVVDRHHIENEERERVSMLKDPTPNSNRESEVSPREIEFDPIDDS